MAQKEVFREERHPLQDAIFIIGVILALTLVVVVGNELAKEQKETVKLPIYEFFNNDTSFTLQLNESIDTIKLTGNLIGANGSALIYYQGLLIVNLSNDLHEEQISFLDVCADTCLINSTSNITLDFKRSEEHTSELQSQFHLVC